MAIVGTAEILILADDSGFEDSLKAGTESGFSDLSDEAGAAGVASGAAMRDGAKDGLADLEGDVDSTGKKIGDDLTDGAGLAGSGAGEKLRKGVKDGLDDMEDDVETSGKSIGDKLTGGLKNGLGGLSGLLSGVGLDVGAFGGAADTAAGKVDKLAKSSGSDGGGLIGTMTSLGRVTTIAGVAGFAAYSAAAIKLGLDLQTTTAQMAAAGDMSSKQADVIAQAFLHSGSQVIYTAQQQVQAYSGVAGQMEAVQGHALSTAQVVAFMSQSMDLAEESGNSLGSTTKTLSSIMQAFQIPISQVSGLTTDLFNAARITGTSIDALGSTMDRMKARLGAAAPSVSDLSTLLVDVSEHGVTGSRGLMVVNTANSSLLKPSDDQVNAQTALKQATDALPPGLDKLAAGYRAGTLTAKQVTDGTKDLTLAQEAQWKAFTSATDAVDKASDSMNKAGLITENAKGQFVGMGSVIAQLHDRVKGETEQQQLATLSTVLGTSANKALLATVDAGPAAYDRAQRAITDAAAAHHALVVQQQTLGHEFDAIKTKVTDMTASFGTQLLPIVRDAIGDFASFLGFLEDHKPILIGIASVIGTVLVSAIGLYIAKLAQAAAESVINFGKMIAGGVEWVAQTTRQFAEWAAEQATSIAESTSLWAMYFAEWVADSAASMAKWVATQATSLASAAKDMVVFVAEHTVAAASFIAENVAMAASATAAFIAENAATLGIVAAIGVLVAGVVWMATHWKEVWGEVKDIATDVWHFLDGVWHSILSGVSAAWGDIMSFFKRWWPEILAVMTLGVSVIPTLLVKYWHQISADITTAWNAVTSFFTTWWNNLVSFFTTEIGLIRTTLLTIWTTISTDIHNVWTSIVSFFQAIPGEILGFFAGAATLLTQVGNDILNGLWNGVLAAWHAIGDIGSTIEGWFTSALSDAGSWLLGVGKSVIDGLAQGILTAVEDTLGKLPFGIGSSIVSAFKSVLGIKSPSTVFAEIGKNMMQGLALGVTGNAHLVTDAMSGVSSTLSNTNLSAGGVSGPGGGAVNPSTTSGGGGNITIAAGAFQVHVHGAVDPSVAAAATTTTQQGLSALTSALQRGSSPARRVPV